MTNQSKWTRALGTAALIGVSLIGATAAAADPLEHLWLAEELVETITPATNSYGSPTKLTWAGENGHEYSTVVAKCAPFVTELLKKAYGVDIKEWFGASSPHAACYHDTIEDEDGFTMIESIEDVKAGDVVAIRNYDSGCNISSCGSYSGCSSTGHVMLVTAVPTPRVATKPLISGTLQYTLKVLDSTSSPHGAGDSRWQANPNNSDDNGAGTGTMRVYVDADDPDLPIVGYTWTSASGSTYFTPGKREMVIGRLLDE